MKIEFNTKYAPGDTVYMLTHWSADRVIVKPRVIKSVTRAGRGGIFYELEPIGISIFDGDRSENALHATEKEALDVGYRRQREYRQRRIDRLQQEILTEEVAAKNRILGIRQDLRERKAAIKEEIKELQ